MAVWRREYLGYTILKLRAKGGGADKGNGHGIRYGRAWTWYVVKLGSIRVNSFLTEARCRKWIRGRVESE